jgi:hypothetical protein
MARTAAEANNWTSVTYGGNETNGYLYVAVASTGTHRVMTSPDGISWTARTAAEANAWQSVTFNRNITVNGGTSYGVFIAVANTGTHRVMTSPDGITWTARTAAEQNSWSSVVAAGTDVVAVAPDGTNRTMYSSDGVSWAAIPAAEANSWNAVGVDPYNYVYVALSPDGTHQVMTMQPSEFSCSTF